MKKPVVGMFAQNDDYFLAYHLWLQDGGNQRCTGRMDILRLTVAA